MSSRRLDASNVWVCNAYENNQEEIRNDEDEETKIKVKNEDIIKSRKGAQKATSSRKVTESKKAKKKMFESKRFDFMGTENDVNFGNGEMVKWKRHVID